LQTELKQILENLYNKYNHQEFIPPDPLQFVYKYTNNSDREIVAFFASALAYGRVEQIEKSLHDLFNRMGSSPFEFVKSFSAGSKDKLRGFKHRFNDENDIADLAMIFKKVLTKYLSLEKLFLHGYNESDGTILPALEIFCDNLMKIHNKPVSRGLGYLLCKPSSGSPCKRLNLFLRWMVRDDEVDSGLWSCVDKAKLIIPVDVHIARLTGFLLMHARANMNLKAAIEITHAFAELNPADPVKYDFALSRIGILENCDGKFRPQCQLCQLCNYCIKRNAEKGA
jgi:uncharacterized protein (TIGR02757 family)